LKKLFHIHSENPYPLLSTMTIVLFSLIITFKVYQYAWISDDALITLRYVTNALKGYGPVFNLGDPVQGYSHPLWFVLLLIGSYLFSDPVLVAIGLGIIFTFVTALLIGFFVFHLTPSLGKALGLLIFYSILYVMSEPWLSFQTSGLENSLSHFIIVVIMIECYFYGISHVGWLTFLLCILCLNRPDFVFFAAPLGLLILWNIRSWRQVGSVILGSLPAIAWLTFAWFYYGNVIPNTAYAKLGVYATVKLAVQQGLKYLIDWFGYDTLAAGITIIFILIFLSTKRHSVPMYAYTSGIILYFLWIIWTGGDFMRGRFFMPIFTATSLLGLLWFDQQLQLDRPINKVIRWGGVLIVIFLLVNQMLMPDPGANISHAGIINERAFYSGFQLEPYLLNGLVDHPFLDLNFVEDLRTYAEKCGPYALHSRNPGSWGYLAGPDVTIIDALGLTDIYIAKLPREFVMSASPRPGHPDKAVPEEYYESRGAISIYPGWQDAITRLNCDFLE